MGLLQTVETVGGASIPVHGGADGAFFETYAPLRLHDADAGFASTQVADLGAIGVARVVSTGHDIGVAEQDCVTLLAPRTGRIITQTSDGEFRSAKGGALLFWPNRRATRVERGDAPRFEAAAIRIPPEAVAAAAERLDRTLTRRVACATISLSLDGPMTRGAAMLAQYCGALLEDLDRPDSLLALPRPRNRAIAYLTETLVEVVENAGALPAHDDAVDAAARRKVRAAEAYMRAHYADIVSISEVAQAIGFGARALQIAFGAVRGETPRDVLTGVRLDAARARLSSPEAVVTVSGVAMDCGFTHLGRFSIAYRRRFGESPSVTLTRALDG